jgi:RNA:NAD 2'-phosphotransferase (TPT1/KptA family)
MRRQYVHLSLDAAMAMQVGKRKAREPVILGVRAGEAHRTGVRF